MFKMQMGKTTALYYHAATEKPHKLHLENQMKLLCYANAKGLGGLMLSCSLPKGGDTV